MLNLGHEARLLKYGTPTFSDSNKQPDHEILRLNVPIKIGWPKIIFCTVINPIMISNIETEPKNGQDQKLTTDKKLQFLSYHHTMCRIVI